MSWGNWRPPGPLSREEAAIADRNSRPMNNNSCSRSRCAWVCHTVPTTDRERPRIATAISRPIYVNPAARTGCLAGGRGRCMQLPADERRTIGAAVRRTAVNVAYAGMVGIFRGGHDPGFGGFGEGIHRNAADVMLVDQCLQCIGILSKIAEIPVDGFTQHRQIAA